ncbi:cytochrome P450 9e2-like isoform X2 [Cherax quadricarinatus]|uniref:cytochrome P450 9e2-like isoform X2 n=1 Tax=Cherax quadricarinatus TaxID=27406 RepID=UPI00387EBE3D
MGVEVWLLVAGVVMAAWAYSRWRHSYWSSRGVSTPPYLPFLGHIHKILSLSQSRWHYFDEVYHKYGGSTFSGLYELFHPVLMIGDPDLLKNILVKDFDHFVDRRKFLSEEGSISNEMLINLTGDEWKTLRGIMSPTFTSGKMRSMFPLMCEKADALVSFSLKEAANKPFVDMKVNFGRFAMDTIASCAFGIECNSFKSEVPEFSKYADMFFNFSFLTIIKFTLFNMFPTIGNALRIKIDSPCTKFFSNVVEETIAARNAGQRRGDYLDLLLDARADVNHPIITDTSIVPHNQSTTTQGQTAQETIITDTSIVPHNQSTTTQDRTAQETIITDTSTVPHNQSTTTQDRTAQETISHDSFVTNVNSIPVNHSKQETLRLYPPSTFEERQCTKTYKIPGTEVTLHPGDVVTYPLWSLHHDPRYWPEPEEFQPDRFLPENKPNITSFTHIPFGMGPRNCIGMRFALMEAKVALAKLLLAAEIHLDKNHTELKTGKSLLVLRPDEGVNLVITPITSNTHG